MNRWHMWLMARENNQTQTEVEGHIPSHKLVHVMTGWLGGVMVIIDNE